MKTQQSIEQSETKHAAALFGGESVSLSKAVNGKTEVFVKCLPVRLLAEYASLFTLEAELIGLATNLTTEEVDMLTPDDSGVLFEKIHELNFEPFSAWLKRKTAAAKRQARIYGASLPQETTDFPTSANLSQE